MHITVRLRSWVAILLGAAGCAAPIDDSAVPEPVSAALILAQPQLIAIGSLDANGADASPETAAPLENGTAGNLLGGIGSAISYLGGQRFLALPDRGPNAVEYRPEIDDTTSYIPRFHTLRLQLRPNRAADADLPYSISPTLLDTTLLFDREPLVYAAGGTPALNRQRRFYFSGRSDNFDASQTSAFPNDARLDPEGIRSSRGGRYVYISDEYGPYVYEFERASGRRTRVFTLPSEFAISKLNAVGDTEIADNPSGRVANKGMEGLAISPDGRTLIGVMQSPLAQDGGVAGRFLRIVYIQLDTGAIEQYAYELSNIGTAEKPKYSGVSEILALSDHEFLVDERDGKGLGDDSEAAFKHIYRVDLRDAIEVSGIAGDAELAGKAVAKTLFLDLVAALNAYGIPSSDIPAKIEGMTFGPNVRIDGARKRTLWISSDNDFLPTITDETHPNGVANPNRFYVFAVDTGGSPEITD